MARKYFIETFGCQMNVLDSEKIAGDLSSHGFEEAGSVQDADVVILNTCSVRDKAVQKVYARLGEIRKFKQGRNDLIVGVAGCMAQLEGDRVLRKAPFVDILAGPQKSYSMHALVEQCLQSGCREVEMRSDEEPAPLEIPHILRRNSWRASVTISEGCSRRCTYCVVPITRGSERVRSSRKILAEIEDLAARGYMEVMLLGQTVNSYIDRENGNVTFPDLLKRIADVEGIKRIRFTSPYPADFSDPLVEVIASRPQICNHLHLPVQSGSTRILKAMGRDYTREAYLEIIRKIYNCGRPISLSTDIIVGFPGEEASDFEETLTLVEEAQYDNAFSFKYSPRPQTEALNLPGLVPEDEKSRRLALLQERQKEIQYARNAAYLGQALEILVEGKARSRVNLTGRTTNNKIVNFDGPESLVGKFTTVKITSYGANSLKGTWIRTDDLK